MRQPIAGALLTSQLRGHFANPTPTRSFPLSLAPQQLLSKRDATPEPGLQPKPVFREDRPTTASWRGWAENSVVENWKEACAEVTPRRFDFASARELPQTLYEFPDGYHQHFGEERYRFTEMLFNPKEYFNQVGPALPPFHPKQAVADRETIEPPAFLRATPSSEHSHSLKDSVPLHQLVHDSIMACDVDVRAALLQNIVIVGNTTLTRGLTERLDAELAILLPSVNSSLLHTPLYDREPGLLTIAAKDPHTLCNYSLRKEVRFLAGRIDPRFSRDIPPALGNESRIPGTWNGSGQSA